MLELIRRKLLWIRGGSFKLLFLAGLLLLAWGTFAPVGTLVWWLSQETESLGLQQNFPKRLPTRKSSGSTAKALQINCYLVFLPGVGDFSADQLAPGEALFLDRLVQAHPNCVAVRDVFPYSIANDGLGGEQLLAFLWRFAHKAEGWLDMADTLIKIRNLWRLAISADSRYGLIYNQGIATTIVERMNAAHPIQLSPHQPLKIILIGTSGGAQVSLGAAHYLDQWLNAHITTVSIGGVFAGTDGFQASERVYHLQGRRDWIEDIGRMVFPSRWPWTVGSPFNRAQRQGSYLALNSGPHTHHGPEGYFGTELLTQTNDTTYLDLTLQQVNQLPIWSVPRSAANRN